MTNTKNDKLQLPTEEKQSSYERVLQWNAQTERSNDEHQNLEPQHLAARSSVDPFNGTEFEPIQTSFVNIEDVSGPKIIS